eukprot:6946444-Pyramimonas_sp.AAC.1
MRQADASDVSESIPVVNSPAVPSTARVKCRKRTTPLRMTRTIQIGGWDPAVNRQPGNRREPRRA